MTNLKERQSGKDKRTAATIAFVITYIMLVVLLGFLGFLCRVSVLGKFARTILYVLLSLPFSQPIFFLLFSPRKEPLGDKYLLLGRVISLAKQIASLVMFFAGGYFGWLISFQLDGLSDKLSAFDKAYADKGISLEERRAAARQTIFDIQNFISDQADIIFSFMSLIIIAWLCLLAADLIRGYMDGDLMRSFQVFDLSINESLATKKRRDSRFIGLIPSQAYFCYRKIADYIASLGFVWFLLYTLLFVASSFTALDGPLQELHAQFNKWLSVQMDQLSALTLS
ncbi:hypothetical protein [Bifidobacterium bifidum]|uniref:hypothetical protein n=1 Tax=Bifidobacterium bifidum TaxID=1681 RepID=UPI001C23C71A|nr:hypothetical protein [Bifidobacterium bifidum]MBU8983151.1 hypothetical protein [Bifidobacterium bifidum]MBU8986697.1 hypothetical protein [Bifidobacterium bifidum]